MPKKNNSSLTKILIPTFSVILAFALICFFSLIIKKKDSIHYKERNKYNLVVKKSKKKHKNWVNDPIIHIVRSNINREKLNKFGKEGYPIVFYNFWKPSYDLNTFFDKVGSLPAINKHKEGKTLSIKEFWTKLNSSSIKEKNSLYTKHTNQIINKNFEEKLELFSNDLTPLIGNEGRPRHIWIGTRKNYTKLHKDSQDNFALVLFGEKTFAIAPPLYCSQAKLTGPYEFTYPNGKKVKHDFRISKIDVNSIEELKQNPILSKIPFALITLKAGDALFLPSDWLHFVETNAPTIMINTWRRKECTPSFLKK